MGKASMLGRSVNSPHQHLRNFVNRLVLVSISLGDPVTGGAAGMIEL